MKPLRALTASGALLLALTASQCSPDMVAPPIVPGAITATGDLGVIRAAHTATLLPDGRVLITGGCAIQSCEGGPISATTELYDAQARRFTPGPRMKAQRSGGHTATLLNDGRVFIAGGWGTTPTAEAELFDPGTNRFVTAPSLNTRRADATASLLPDGRVLIAGGYDGANRLASAELYDPATGTMTPTGSMAGPRSAHVAVVLDDGRVLLIGGHGGSAGVLRSAELYDPGTARFTLTGEMSLPRHKHAAELLPDGSVLVVGGSDSQDAFGRYDTAERYDPAAGSFSPAGTMHAERYKLSAAVTRLGDGEVLVAGGAPMVERFDPRSGGFLLVPGNLGGSFAFSTATRLANADVLIAGGYDDRVQLTNRAWLYRPAP
jgi:hypothetical protein